jgi:hypothetical protein
MRNPNIISILDIVNSKTTTNVKTEHGTQWVPARTHGYPSFFSRIKAAWTVFIGAGDAVVWPD